MNRPQARGARGRRPDVVGVTLHDRRSSPRSPRGSCAPAPGFTSIELVVVFTILAVVTAMSLPGFAAALRFHAVASSARSVSSALFVAKTRAAMQGTHTRVRIAPDGRSFLSEVLDRASGTWTAAAGLVPFPGTVAFGFGAATVPPDGRSEIAQKEPIEFNARGVPVDAATGIPTDDSSLYVTNGEDTFAVLVSVGGRVEVLRARPTGWVAY